MKKILICTALVILLLIFRDKESIIIIPNDAIRFRIIAASNTLEDQNIKNELSVNVSNYLNGLLKVSNSAEESKEILYKNKINIDTYITDYLKNNNINYGYEMNIGKNYFPKKKYKGVTYEEGYYDSISVSLGRKSGVNWWCIIYPPLCLIPEDEDVEYTTLVKELLNDYMI